jgi:subtilisin family serine protease
MKKRLVMVIFSIILLLSILVSALSYSREVAVSSTQPKRVIVVLKDKPLPGFGEEEELNKRMISNAQQRFTTRQGQGSFLLDAEQDFVVKRRYHTLNALAVEVSEERLQKIRSDPDVLQVYYDKPIYASLDVSASVVNATTTWKLIYNNSNITGSGQTVCVLDTGVDYTHNNFGDCSSATFLNGSCEKVIAGYDFVNNDQDPMDDYGHGTHCAGIIASNHSTYRGIAPDSKIVAIKVLNSAGDGSTSDLISGIEWCTNNASKYNITVMSMSLGTDETYINYCDGEEPTLTQAINNAIAANISVIAATGNDNDAVGIDLPACIKNVTSIGATTKADAMASYTNRNNVTDLFAPGTSIVSLYPTDTTTSSSGTSMSTPHVAAAFALLRQYKELESNIDLTPTQIESTLNSTGKEVNDTCDICSNLSFRRINIFEAIKSLDTIAPQISFADPTPDDGGTAHETHALINTTSSEVLSNALIEWNNTNYTMTGSYTNWFRNMTNSPGNISYRVYGNDSSNNLGFTQQRSVLLGVNTKPQALNTSIICSDSQNRTSGNLGAWYAFYDADSDQEQDNQTLWFVNNTLVSAYNNLVSINSTNTSKNQNWTLSVSVFDGLNWSNWSNSSMLTIQNTAPVLESINNLTINETNYANITATASDLDGDNLSYSINDSRFSQSNNHFSWKTNTSDSGEAIVNISVSDGLQQDWQKVTITIDDAADTDNDGIIDFEDIDDDNDGINDSTDFIKGNISNVNSSITDLAITFNGSDNATNQFNATYFIQILNSTDTLVEFNISLSNETGLDLTNVTIEKNNTGFGSLIVYGIRLPQASKKNVFVDNITTANGVCIKDTDDTSLDAFSQDCKALNESFVACPGSRNQYHCNINGTRFKVSGLVHSLVKQDNDTAAPIITSISTSTSGTTITLSLVTDETASCRYATSNLTYPQMSVMSNTNGLTHSNSISYSSTTSGTYYARCNDTSGNVMNHANTTSFSIIIVSGGDIGGGGGGGGGGGARPVTTNVTNLTQEEINVSVEEIVDVTDITLERPANITNISLEEPLPKPEIGIPGRLKAALGVIMVLLFLLSIITIIIRTKRPERPKFQ